MTAEQERAETIVRQMVQQATHQAANDPLMHRPLGTGTADLTK